MNFWHSLVFFSSPELRIKFCVVEVLFFVLIVELFFLNVLLFATAGAFHINYDRSFSITATNDVRTSNELRRIYLDFLGCG